MRKRPLKSQAKAGDRKGGESRRERVLLLAIGSFVGILPLVWSPSGLDQYRAPKDIFFFVGAIWLTAIYVVTRRRFDWRWRSWEGLLGVGLLYLIFHSLLSGRWETTLWATLWVLFGAAILWTLSGTGSIAFHRTLWLVLGTGSAIDAIVAVLQYYGYLPFFLGSTGEVLQGRYTPAGFVGEVDSGGFLFGLCSLMLVFPLATARTFWLRAISAALLAANLAGLAVSQTITALLATGVVFALWIPLHVWWMARTHRSLSTALRKALPALCLAVALITALLVFSGSWARLDRVWTQLQKGDLTLLTSGRYPVYMMTWSMIQERPFTGRGLNTFGTDFFFYKADKMANLRVLNEPGAWHEAHDEYLQIWEELGLPGLALFLALLVAPIVTALSFARRSADADAAYWAALLSLGTVFVALCSLGIFPFRVSLTVLCILVLFANLRRLTREPTSAPVHLNRSGSFLPVVVCGLVCVFVSYSALGWWRANTEAGRAALLLERAVASPLSSADRRFTIQGALRRLAEAEGRSPVRHQVHNLKGSAYALLGDYEAAAREYSEAATSIPSPEVITNLAIALHATGRKAQAEELLKQALRYNPDYRKAASALRYVQKNRN
jgi:O-antigen ligase